MIKYSKFKELLEDYFLDIDKSNYLKINSKYHCNKSKHRVYFDFKADNSNFTKSFPKELSTYLTYNGFTNHSNIDYINGTYIDKHGRIVRIGKLLKNNTQTKLLDIYNKSRDGKLVDTSNLEIVISCHPYDLLGASSDRNWTSCYDLNCASYGGRAQHQKDLIRHIKNGAVIVYLIRKGDRNINNPLSRVLFFKNYNGRWIHSSVYGITKISNFISFSQGKIKEMYK